MLKEVKQTEEEIRIGELCYEYRIEHNLELYENEIWKFIEGEDVEYYSDEYLVSNMGWVASYKKGRISNIRKGYKIIDINTNIIYQIKLTKNNKSKSFKVHRLVAQVFCYNDNPKEKTVVNHIIERSETQCDNRACNLEWCTYSENSKHSGHKNKGNNYGKRVRCVRTGEIFPSLKNAGESVSVNYYDISNSINKGCKSGGEYWEYVDEKDKTEEPLQLEGEIWKPIEGYEGLYEISNLGRVKSLNYGRTNKSKILKPSYDCGGYMSVVLCKYNKQKRIRVHKLVALHFCEGYKEGLVVNHKNHIRDDNRSENLEWITYKENRIR